MGNVYSNRLGLMGCWKMVSGWSYINNVSKRWFGCRNKLWLTRHVRGAYWVYASYGDALATLADYQQKPLALDSTFTGDSIVAGDNINSHRDDNGFLYLSVIVRSGGIPPYFWGWALLQGQTVVESALSDMPLVVGTGQVIPEPSSALLLLVGGAMLALKRRRANLLNPPPY